MAVGQGLERLRRRIDDEEMDVAGVARLHHRGRDLGRRFHADALEREIDLQHAGRCLRVLVPDLSADEGTLAALENDSPIGHERLVARIAGDLDIADGDTRLGW